MNQKLYDKELKHHNHSSIVAKMVDFKVKNFPNCNHVIVDFSTENDILQVKTQTQENHFNNVLSQVINVKRKSD